MPPISDEIISQPAHSFVLAPGDWPLIRAVAELKQRDGQEWWFLIVEIRGDQQDPVFRACQFFQLRQRIQQGGHSTLDTLLQDLGEPLVPVSTVLIQNDLEIARGRAQKNPLGAVIVLDEHRAVRGLISLRQERSIPRFDEPTLFELAGLVLAGPGTHAQQSRHRHAEGAAPTSPAPVSGAEPPEEAEEADASPRAEKPAAEGNGGISVHIGDDVESGGQVLVAGGDINMWTPPVEQQTRVQMRRFEAAFPQEASVGVEEKLEVAVMLPSAPSPFTGERPRTVAGADQVPIAMPVDRASGELVPVDIEVVVTAAAMSIKGDPKKLLTVHPDGRTVTRWFVLEPAESGKQEILIELLHKGRLLDEIRIESIVYAPESKARSALNLSLKIVTFGLQFSFSAVGAG